MTACSNTSEMHPSFGENLDADSIGDDLVRLITNEIQETLQLDDNELEGKIVTGLLANGRRSLVKYKDDIIPRVYNELMNTNDNQLMLLLKKYFRQKWETQYRESNQWFLSLLEQCENGDNRHVYERVLNRAAQNGNKYMNGCPILSIVLQIVLASVDDELFEKNFTDLWFTITNGGLASTATYADFTVKAVIDEQLKTRSILFQALREYYRENVLLSLEPCKIGTRNNLYELALDDVAEHGWLTDMTFIRDQVPPKAYRALTEKLHSFYTEQRPNVRHVPTKKLDLNPGLLPSESNTAEQRKQDEKQEAGQSDDSDDSMSVVDGDEVGVVAKPRAVDRYGIFITRLPTNMPEQKLFDTLWDVFSTVGRIRIDRRRGNKPVIHLCRRKGNQSRLNGAARIIFEKEASATEAIEKYNGKPMSELNNAWISVMPLIPQAPRPVVSSMRILTSRLGSAPLKASEKKKDKPQNADKRDDSIVPRHVANDFHVDRTANLAVSITNRIRITGLPSAMPEQNLFDTLSDVFSTVGQIKIDAQTGKPAITLFKRKNPSSELECTATITFDIEASAINAVAKYNGKFAPALNGAQIFVKMSERQFERQTPAPPVPKPRSDRQPDGKVNIFWDIENLAIPFGQSAFSIVRKLRQKLIVDRNLMQGPFFNVYCNVTRLSPDNLRDLDRANVTTKHIGDQKPGAADRAIFIDLQLVKELYKTPTTVVLLSGDIDFIRYINELRFSHQHYVILVYNVQARFELLETANEALPWHEFTELCSREPNTTAKNATKKVLERPSATARTEHGVAKIFSPEHSPHRTQERTGPTKHKPLMELYVCEGTPQTGDNVTALTSSGTHELSDALQLTPQKPRDILQQTPVLRSKTSVTRNQRKNEKRPEAQPVQQLTPPSNDPLDSSSLDCKPVVSSMSEDQASKNQNKTPEISPSFCCSVCAKKFSTNERKIQHEADKHQIGTLVEFDSVTLIDSSHDTQPHIDLMVMENGDAEDYGNDDNDNSNDDNDFDFLGPSLLTAAGETVNRAIDDKDLCALFLGLGHIPVQNRFNDSERLEESFSDKGKSTETVIDENTIVCEMHKAVIVNRYSDIKFTFEKLPAVDGCYNEPLVSIEEALEAMVQRIPQLSHQMQVAKRDCHYPSEHGLTHDESASVYIYTMEVDDNSLYRVLNRTLQSEDQESLKMWFSYLKLFDTALKKLPTFKGVVWRGVPVGIANNFTKGDMVIWCGVNSCSSLAHVTQKFLSKEAKATLFRVDTVNGRSISGYTAHENEDEIILGIGTQLRVKGHSFDHSQGSDIVDFEEIGDNDAEPLRSSMNTMSVVSKLSNPDGPTRSLPIIAAGGHQSGKALNQLSNPCGLYVDDTGIYVADCNNHRIVKWTCGANSGTQVAGANDSGNGANGLSAPSDVIVHEGTDSLIVCDKGNQRVVQWSRPNGVEGRTIISSVGCVGLAVDDEGFIYVADAFRHEVTRRRIGEANGVVVAGGNGRGGCQDQLDSPQYLFVDRDHSLYVSDSNNHRVMKWFVGAEEGIVVAGGNGPGSLETQLRNPAGVVVDQFDTVYVADCGNNRIMCWSQGATKGRAVTEEYPFYLEEPVGLSLDRLGNFYVVDRGNNRVQRFKI